MILESGIAFDYAIQINNCTFKLNRLIDRYLSFNMSNKCLLLIGNTLLIQGRQVRRRKSFILPFLF